MIDMDYKEPEMWEHYCEEEHSMMGVGKGEPCNWCGLTEEEHMKEKDIIAMDMRHEVEEPYRNYAKEALEILNRMERKIDALIEQKENNE